METEMKSAAKAEEAAPVAAQSHPSAALQPTTIVVTAPLPRRRASPAAAPESGASPEGRGPDAAP